MRRSDFLRGFFAMFLGAASMSSSGAAEPLKVWLEPNERAGLVEFQGYVSAATPMLVEYRLTIVRIGKGGRMSTSQSGRVQVIQPNEPTRLSSTAVNVSGLDRYEAILVARGEDGHEVRVEIGQTPL